MSAQFLSMNDVLEADARGELDDETFDDQLWACLISESGPLKPSEFEPAVRTYVASWIIEGDVGNGGFAQAAYNNSQWFEDAAIAYEAMGLPLAGERIRKAMSLIADGAANFTRDPGVGIGEVFAEFCESALSDLNKGLEEIGWWAATGPRVGHVRANRDAFFRMKRYRSPPRMLWPWERRGG